MRIISSDPLLKKLVDARINRKELAEKAGFSRGKAAMMEKMKQQDSMPFS